MKQLLKILEKITSLNTAPLADLEEVLVPLYFAHRYQIEAVSKLIGGVEYTYAIRGDNQVTNKVVPSRSTKKSVKCSFDRNIKSAVPSNS